MFNRRANEEERSSLSSDELLGRRGSRGCYGGYFPEMQHDDLGSDGTHLPDSRHDSHGEAVCTVDDDFPHALFAQEQMLMNCVENGKHFIHLKFIIKFELRL